MDKKTIEKYDKVVIEILKIISDNNLTIKEVEDSIQIRLRRYIKNQKIKFDEENYLKDNFSSNVSK